MKTTKRKVKSVFLSIGLITVFTFLLIMLDGQIRPIIITIANYQSRITAVLTINESVNAELQSNPQLYQNLLTASYDESGNVTALNANALLINEAKANLTEVVAKSLEGLREEKISIPLGTIFGWQLLSGKGPDIEFAVIPASYVESDIVTKIESAGINQTKNSIYMRFNVTVSAIIPGYTTSVDVENDVLIADVLVVGETPIYYGVNGTGAENFVDQNVDI